MYKLVNITPMSKFGMETGWNHHIMVWVNDDDIIKDEKGEPSSLSESGWEKVAKEYGINQLSTALRQVLILHFYNDIEINAMIERTENTIVSLTRCLDEAKDTLYRFKNHLNFNEKLTKD